MNLLTFILLGLLNGSLVGLAVVLWVRAISPGIDCLRIRDAAFVGMLGSLAGNAVAMLVCLNDGYVSGGQFVLMYAVVGAALPVGIISCTQLLNRTRRQPTA